MRATILLNVSRRCVVGVGRKVKRTLPLLVFFFRSAGSSGFQSTQFPPRSERPSGSLERPYWWRPSGFPSSQFPPISVLPSGSLERPFRRGPSGSPRSQFPPQFRTVSLRFSRYSAVERGRMKKLGQFLGSRRSQLSSCRYTSRSLRHLQKKKN